MSILLVVMLTAASIALVLGLGGVRRVGPAALVAEGVMLAAMVDVHLPALGFVPAPFWALLLGGCALGTATADRLRRSARPTSDHLHALGMLLGAVFVLLGGSHDHGVGHEHGGAVLLPVAVAVAVHVGAVVRDLARVRVPRAEAARRAASLVSVLAMGAMVIVH